jgi:hypothetical protein
MRPYFCYVSAWGDDETHIMHILYREGLISRIVRGVSTPVMPWQFEEWFSFSLARNITLTITINGRKLAIN